ncbi:MAG TPA: TadE/TadG family type IV pilus assembly protein [Caulobacteraceae bacterium]
MTRRSSFLTDRTGAAATEIALLAPVFFVGLFAMFDLGLYFWRWNQAVEAARVGARLAVISDPVASDLSSMTGLETGVQPGQPVGAYERVCAPSACTNGVYSAAAMNRIFYGPGAQGCSNTARTENSGMCDVLPILQPSNVTVTYRSSGVDTAGVVGALKPLVSVRVSGARPNLFFIDHFVPGRFTTLPDAEVTVLAEDLRTSA